MNDGGMVWWLLASGAATVYCIVRSVVDLRQKRYVWAAIGLISAAILLLSPVQTHAVKLDFPMSNEAGWKADGPLSSVEGHQADVRSAEG